MVSQAENHWVPQKFRPNVFATSRSLRNCSQHQSRGVPSTRRVSSESLISARNSFFAKQRSIASFSARAKSTRYFAVFPARSWATSSSRFMLQYQYGGVSTLITDSKRPLLRQEIRSGLFNYQKRDLAHGFRFAQHVAGY
jgi:hypothetical protein